MSFDILPFEKKHIPDVLELEGCCFGDPYSQSTLESTADSPRDVAFVCTVDGRIAGYIELGDFIDTLCVNRIAVFPEFRKNGIATRLLEKAKQAAAIKEIGELSLEVRASNTAARSLYEKFGFILVGKRLNYYRDPKEDAAIYILKL